MQSTTDTLGYELLTHPDGYLYWRTPAGRIWPYVAGGADEGDNGGDGSDTDTGTDRDTGSDDGASGEGAEGDSQDGSTDDPAKLRADADKWKALARKHEKQAKENSTAAKRLAELEDADKSALDKATERAASAETRAEAAEKKLLRYEAAAKAGLDSKHIHRLHGDDEDELLADAKALKDELQPKVNGDADGGARGGDDKKKPASLEDAVTAALK